MMMSEIDRRQVIGGLAAATATGGCSVRSDGPDGTPAGPRRLVAVIGEDPPSLNPAVSTVISCLEAAAPAYDGLMDVGPDGGLSPRLAIGWSHDDDYRTYTFRLRPSVRWHDDRPFTSADVKFTIEEVLAKFHPFGRQIYRSLETVDTPDPLTAIVRLSQGYAQLLATAFAFWPMLPRHLWAGTDFTTNPHAKAPIGTGPYRFVDYASGEHIRYARNRDYFERHERVFDEIVLRIIPSPSAQSIAFENGDVDILHSSALPAPNLRHLLRTPGAQLNLARSLGGAFVLTMNQRTRTLADRRVRHAIAHAVDRAFIRRSVLPLVSQPMIGPLWPQSSLYHGRLPDYVHSVARADALLDEAGLARGEDDIRFTLRTLWASTDLRLSKMADILHANLRAVGIRLDLQPLDRATMIQRAYVAGQFDLTIETFALGPDPDFGTERLYNSDNIKPQPFVNTSGYRNPEVDALFDRQRTAFDPAARKAIYDRIQELIWADLPLLPIAGYGVPSLHDVRAVTGVFARNWTSSTDAFVAAAPP